MIATNLVEQRQTVTDTAEFGRVAVLLGGNSSEREVSLDTGAAVLKALQSRGVDAHAWDPAENSMADFATAGFERVWIALHGPGGEDGALQGLLQWLEIPYTGSGVMASAISPAATAAAWCSICPGRCQRCPPRCLLVRQCAWSLILACRKAMTRPLSSRSCWP